MKKIERTIIKEKIEKIINIEFTEDEYEVLRGALMWINEAAFKDEIRIGKRLNNLIKEFI